MIALYPGNFLLQSKLFSSSWLHSGCVCVCLCLPILGKSPYDDYLMTVARLGVTL